MNCPLCKGAQFKAFSIFFFFYKTSDATLFYTIHIQTQWHNYRSDLIFIFTIHILLVLQTVCLCGQQKKWLADQKVTKVKVKFEKSEHIYKFFQGWQKVMSTFDVNEVWYQRSFFNLNPFLHLTFLDLIVLSDCSQNGLKKDALKVA